MEQSGRGKNNQKGAHDVLPKHLKVNRSCTDVIWLCLFVVFVGCWIGIGIYAFKNGDPETLLVPKDSKGKKCGIDIGVKGKPYLFFFDISKCLTYDVAFSGCATTQICVEKCPTQYFHYDSGKIKPNDFICRPEVDKPTSVAEGRQMVDRNDCAKYYLPSQPLLKRCVYDLHDNSFTRNYTGISVKKLREVNQHLKNALSLIFVFCENIIFQFTEDDYVHKVGGKIIDDVYNSGWVITAGLAIAMIFCLVYVLLMRWIAKIMVWISLLGIVAILVFCVYGSSVQYEKYQNSYPTSEDIKETIKTSKNTWLVALIVSSALLVIVVLMILFLRSRIVLAIALIKEGSKAVGSLTSTLFFPVITWLLQILVISYTIAVGLYLASTGDATYKPLQGINQNCDCPEYFDVNKTYTIDRLSKCTVKGDSDTSCNAYKFSGVNNPKIVDYFHAWNIIGFFWGVFFVSALGEMIMATTFASWYWTFKKSDVPFFTLSRAILITLRYHLGTLAFGSLIVAICRMIRVVLEYIDHKLKKYDNVFIKAVLCCCKCFFWCLENFLKFINKNAYIMCAIHGKNFCRSAKDAFGLLSRNIIRVVVLDKVTDFLFFIGKLIITAGAGCVAYFFVHSDAEGIEYADMNYDLVPVIIICIGTYFIASVFFSVYEMAVDTLFLCFLEDSEINNGSAEKPYYMSKNLMKILGKKNKTS